MLDREANPFFSGTFGREKFQFRSNGNKFEFEATIGAEKQTFPLDVVGTDPIVIDSGEHTFILTLDREKTKWTPENMREFHQRLKELHVDQLHHMRSNQFSRRVCCAVQLTADSLYTSKLRSIIPSFIPPLMKPVNPENVRVCVCVCVCVCLFVCVCVCV